MFKISKLEREYLEEIGVLSPIQGKYKNMYVCNVHRKSKKKTYYVNDNLKYYLTKMVQYYNSKRQSPN
jgi:hypothetical protein